MEQLKPWHTLNINISNAIKSDFDFKNLYNNSVFSKEQLGLWFYSNDNLEKLFNTQWLEYMKSIDLEVGCCIVFYRKPNYYRDEVHLDILDSGIPSVCALNWILDPDDDSEMIWYENTVPLPPFIKLPDNDIRYLSWPLSDFTDKEIARHTIGNQLTLVNVGIPHNVQVKNAERWCISIRLKNKIMKDWNHAVETFSKFIC